MSTNIYNKNENKLINVSNNLVFTKDHIDEVSTFSSHNMLLDVNFFDSEFATTVKKDDKVYITFHDTSKGVEWYSLTGLIKFNTRKCYKITCNNTWTGYGRLGINKVYTSSFSRDFNYSSFGIDGSRCGTNALGNWYIAYNEDAIADGDNHVLSRETINDKYFRIIPTSYKDNPINGSLWVCTDETDVDGERKEFTIEIGLYINKTIKDIHSVNITLLQSAERYRTEGLNMRGYEITFPSSLWYNIGASNNAKYAPGSNFSTWSRASYMARVNYGLMDKYLLTVTGRFDGASMLAAGNKWDFFPSAALAWRMEQEKWIQQINWINQLKLRVGYGVTGNSAVNPYQTAGSVTSTYASIPFGVGNVSSNTIGTKTNIMPNYSLGWEKTSSLNVGVDFGVLENRISGSVEYYIAKTSDLLMNQSIPVITGYAQILNNVGKTENRGFEVSLSTVNVKTKDFTWQTDWTFSLNNEKIKELAGGATYDSTGPWMVGEPLNSFYDFQYDRIWQNTQEDNHLMDVYRSLGLTFLPGQYKIVDQPLVEVPQGTEGSKTVEIKDAAGNKTGEVVSYMDNGFGKFDDNDKKIYNKSPKWTGGINNSFTYKNWNLSFFTYFRFGNTYYGLTQTIGRRIEKDTWSPTNTDAKFAQPTTATRETKYDYVRNYTKGNMVLIKNIALSYTVPQSWLKKCGASSAQVYAQVLNPFLFGGELVKAGINPDDLTGWDAGNHIGGQTNNTCITRSLVLGVRLGF